jgi:asparagine synthase (glutamine-hydrolysing)
MAGIAGIANPEKKGVVEEMLDRISYRGSQTKTVPVQKAVFGMVYSEIQPVQVERIQYERLICDEVADGHFACAKFSASGLTLSRDQLGVAPLYYGLDHEGDLCFASEVKGLLGLADDIHELPPGSRFADGKLEMIHPVETNVSLKLSSSKIATELRRRLTGAVQNRVGGLRHFGSLLSGGLDSSAIASIARPFAEQLETFAAGLEGAPDLLHARDVAWHLNTQHHERVVEFKEMLDVLPEVIYHLESFDALLVRSSIMHFLAAQVASDYVPAVLSGEGGDELFAGYSYLKDLSIESLPNELVDITNRLHNTALQRVDRCTLAHGVTAWVPFLDPQVVSYAMQIPAFYKLNHGTEKWILRQAVKDLLPPEVVSRPKAKFWEGAGVAERLAQYADTTISDADFNRERLLPNGWKLSTKEELFYYRMFKEHFGVLHNLDWMGRTKGTYVQ